ncbi:hypothetical protein, conserved [Plasmodium gonderi]|uniref:Uncharacterized protein n=1 Tax=Plasmodium gonderi TaxID=77519 RepID=A0A1Y1JEX4_PLAGO|nr:hypothetical protein, conserved [Plasmodium gonderi]GAW81081.1 hypothetical protein, conserved [Plasmodium gonderi]
MKHLVTTQINVTNRCDSKRLVGKRLGAKKWVLHFSTKDNYCSSIFDLIAKKREELSKKCKNGVFEEPKRVWRNDPPSQVVPSITREHDDGRNAQLRMKEGKEEKAPWEERTRMKKESLYKVNNCITNERSLDDLRKVEGCVIGTEENIYNNKAYILKYIKQLQPNDDLGKYRFITKYIMNNIREFYDNEILFILKIFSKRKYKNLPFLQCTSEYFYWLCKLNKGSKKNISYYLHFCSILNYIPTMKYIHVYTKLFNYCEDEIQDNNFFIFNMLEEETNAYHKDLKYIIMVLFFLNKGNIKNKTYDTLLYMCCYYSSHLSLKNTFLLLKIVLNEENNKYNFDYIRTIHKNIERHFDSMCQVNFINYFNILLQNHVHMEQTFFVFIRNYVDKFKSDLSRNSVIPILKMLKRVKFKDTIILKKLLTVVSANFYDYSYADIVYIVKMITLLNYFDERFFYFLFDKFVPPDNEVDMGTYFPKWRHATLNCDRYIQGAVGVGIGEGGGRRRMEISNERERSPHLQNEHIYFYSSKGLLHNNYGSEKRRPFFTNHERQVDDIGRSSGYSHCNPFEKTNFEMANMIEGIRPNDCGERVQKKKAINELSHLPLHLYEQKVKMKINISNIMEEKVEIAKPPNGNKLSYGLEYIEMYLNLFLYLGICGFRSMPLLIRLSKMINLCLLMNRDTSSSLTNSFSLCNIRHKEYYHQGIEETKFVTIHDTIKKIKNELNSTLGLKKSSSELSADMNYLLPSKEQTKGYSKNDEIKGGHSLDKRRGGYESGCKVSLQSDCQRECQSECQRFLQNQGSAHREGRKSCMRFVYPENEKLNFENLKKKKIKSNLHKEEKDEEDKILSLKYLNVDLFRKSKLLKNPRKGNCVTLKEGSHERIGRTKQNSIVAKIFGNFHPALIRLHNRRLFRRNFDEMYQSERYTEKVIPKRHVRIKGVNFSNDLQLTKYREIKNLRNVCLNRYSNMFGETSDKVLEYINKIYQIDESKEDKKTEMFDMTSDNKVIHVDDALFVDYSLCANKGKKKALSRHRNMVKKSNRITHKEYTREGVDKRPPNVTTEDYSHPNGDLIKWLYRYKNNLKCFFYEKGLNIIHLLDGDIKFLEECVQDLYKRNETTTSSNGKSNDCVEDEKVKISLKYIALLTNSCVNLYYFDEKLIDMLVFHVSEITNLFYLTQSCKEKKITRNEDSMPCHAFEKGYSYLYLFKNMCKFLTACLQMNCFMKNILSLDHRYETITKLVHISTSSYIFYNLKNITYLMNHLNANFIKQEKVSYLIKRFLLYYLDISIIINLFFIFCKKLFILMSTNCQDFLNNNLELFHLFTYTMLTFYIAYSNERIKNLHNLTSTSFHLCAWTDRAYIQEAKFLSCINFYVMFLSAISSEKKKKKKTHTQTQTQKQTPYLPLRAVQNGNSTICGESQNGESVENEENARSCQHHRKFKSFDTSSDVIQISLSPTGWDREKNIKINNSCELHMDMYTVLALSLKYIKLMSKEKFFLRHKNGKNKDHRHLYNILQFYYIFKKIIRKKNVNYINEETYHEMFPSFVIKLLNEKRIKEISMDQLFPVIQQEQHYHHSKHATSNVNIENTVIYNYFFHLFFE